jgi:hypothetical protein
VADIIEKLDVSGTLLTGLPFDDMISNCRNLEELCADRCVRIHFPRSFRSARQPKNAVMLPKLAWLRFDFASYFPTELLRLLFERRTPLKALSLNCTLSPGIVASVLDCAVLPRLEHLALATQNITDRLFADVIALRLGSSLITLDLSKCRQLTGTLLNESVHKFPVLTRINLSGSRFSEDACVVLWKCAPHLEEFLLDSCRSVMNRDLRRDPLLYLKKCRRDQVRS